MKKRTRVLRYHIFSVLILLAISLWCLGPLTWIGITSIKPQGTEFRIPVEYWPDTPTLDNYREITAPRFRVQRAVLNSVIVSGLSVVGTLVLSMLSAYAIARMRFKYRFQTLYLMQIAGMVPPIVTIGPTFVLLRYAGLLRTYWAMILPNIAYGIPFASFLIASYFANVPFDVDDAAKLDGCGTLRTIYHIILPISAPGIFSAGVLAFLGSWGEFMLALTVTLGKKEVETVPVAILNLSQAFELQWTWIAAGTILSLFPIIIGVLVFQRFVVSGLTAGSIK